MIVYEIYQLFFYLVDLFERYRVIPPTANITPAHTPTTNHVSNPSNTDESE